MLLLLLLFGKCFNSAGTDKMGGILHSVLNWLGKTYRDGGSTGWFAALGLFSTWVVWMSLLKGLAVMLQTLHEQFDVSTWVVGWTIAIIDAGIEFSGKLFE